MEVAATATDCVAEGIVCCREHGGSQLVSSCPADLSAYRAEERAWRKDEPDRPVREEVENDVVHDEHEQDRAEAADYEE
jgi:hypothetical protein